MTNSANMSSANTAGQFINLACIPNSRHIARSRLLWLILLLLAYFVLSTLIIVTLGAMSVNLVRFVFYAVVWGALWSVSPRLDRQELFLETQADVAGIWPENWSPRRSMNATLASGLILGGVIAWFLLESVLLGSESWRLSSSRGLVELLLGLDLIVIWSSIVLAFWLWWEPFLQRDAVLTIAPKGLCLIGYPDLQVPERISWTELRKVQLDQSTRPMLYLWYRPRRKVFGVQLPQLSLEEQQHLSHLLNTLGAAEPTREATSSCEAAPRRFDQLLDRLKEQRGHAAQSPDDGANPAKPET